MLNLSATATLHNCDTDHNTNYTMVMEGSQEYFKLLGIRPNLQDIDNESYAKGRNSVRNSNPTEEPAHKSVVNEAGKRRRRYPDATAFIINSKS